MQHAAGILFPARAVREVEVLARRDGQAFRLGGAGCQRRHDPRLQRTDGIAIRIKVVVRLGCGLQGQFGCVTDLKRHRPGTSTITKVQDFTLGARTQRKLRRATATRCVLGPDSAGGKVEPRSVLGQSLAKTGRDHHVVFVIARNLALQQRDPLQFFLPFEHPAALAARDINERAWTACAEDHRVEALLESNDDFAVAEQTKVLGQLALNSRDVKQQRTPGVPGLTAVGATQPAEGLAVRVRRGAGPSRHLHQAVGLSLVLPRQPDRTRVVCGEAGAGVGFPLVQQLVERIATEQPWFA